MIPNALGFSETLAPIYAAPSTTSSQASFAYQPKKRAGSMQPIKVSPKRSGQEYATSTDGRSEPFAAPADEQQKEQASAASALSTDVKMTADAEEEVLPLEPEEALQEEDGEPDHTVSEHEDQEEDAPACPHPNIHPSSPPIPPAPLLPQPDKVVLVSSSTTSSQAEPTAKPASAEASLPAPPAPVAAPPPSVPVPAPLPAPALVRAPVPSSLVAPSSNRPPAVVTAAPSPAPAKTPLQDTFVKEWSQANQAITDGQATIIRLQQQLQQLTAREQELASSQRTCEDFGRLWPIMPLKKVKEELHEQEQQAEAMNTTPRRARSQGLQSIVSQLRSIRGTVLPFFFSSPCSVLTSQIACFCPGSGKMRLVTFQLQAEQQLVEKARSQDNDISEKLSCHFPDTFKSLLASQTQAAKDRITAVPESTAPSMSQLLFLLIFILFVFSVLCFINFCAFSLYSSGKCWHSSSSVLSSCQFRSRCREPCCCFELNSESFACWFSASIS